MVSGEIEYGDIFFKDRPPIGFGKDWDQDWEKVPFPVVTYSMFIAFVIVVTFLAFNVLVGLTVDDIRKFLEDADLRNVRMRLEFICQMEQHKQIRWIKTKILGMKRDPLNNTIAKTTSFQAMIWKEIEKRKMKSRAKGKMEDELNKTQLKIKELKKMNTATNNLVAEMNLSIAEIKSSIAEIKTSLQRSKLSG